MIQSTLRPKKRCKLSAKLFTVISEGDVLDIIVNLITEVLVSGIIKAVIIDKPM